MMPNNPRESSFMMAAAKNIEDLQVQVTVAQNAANAAKADARIAKEAAEAATADAKRWHALTKWLTVVCIVALVASGLSIYNWVRQADATNQLRQQAITSCEAGNNQRAAEVKVWKFILTATLAGSKRPGVPPAQQKATVVFVKTTETFIARELAPRNCAQAYNSAAAKGQ